MWEQIKHDLNHSLAQLLGKLASLLPGMIAMVVALLISALIAWIAGMVVRRLLASLQFDERLIRWGFPSLAEWAPKKSPTLLVARVVSWSIVVVGLLIGIAAFDAALTSMLVNSIFSYVPNVLGAALVLLVGNIIARYLARSVLIGAVNLNLQYGRLLSVGVKWLVIVLAVAMALEHLKIGSGTIKLAFAILFGGIVLALALAVGLGSKDLVTKSLEGETKKIPSEIREPFRHL